MQLATGGASYTHGRHLRNKDDSREINRKTAIQGELNLNC